MKPLLDKHVLLGINGSIAAYKSADLTRRLRDAGALVRVVMTRAATQFIGPLTLQSLSGHPVHVHLFDQPDDPDQPVQNAATHIDHIALARWAEVILIAPASANFIAKLAHGLADDLLSTVCLATQAPIVLAPAMNRVMWQNPGTRANVAILADRGILRLGPTQGEQACGEAGPGRMLEPCELIDRLVEIMQPGLLRGRKVLITAGPTREDIDPVRYISNRSSGKMGFAIARAAAAAGARVTLVSGPVNLATPPGIERLDIHTAEQMYRSVMSCIETTDIFIAAAAVTDYRPVVTPAEKIKRRNNQELTITLQPNPDILAAVASLPRAPFTVGFAAETADLKANALAKLTTKSLDMIAANRVGQEGSGFESDENALNVYWEGGGTDLPQMHKDPLARKLVAIIAQRYQLKLTT